MTEKIIACIITTLIILTITLLGRIIRWIVEKQDHKQDHTGQDHKTSDYTFWMMVDDDSSVVRVGMYFAVGLGVIGLVPLLLYGLIEVVEWVRNII